MTVSKAAKPSALISAASSAVDDYPDRATSRSTSREPVTSPAIYNVAIALGSNLSDSFRNIEYALRLLEYLPQEEQLDGKDLPFVRITDTSFLYETKPMYVTDQPAFINAACMVYFPSLVKKAPLVNLYPGGNKHISHCPAKFT